MPAGKKEADTEGLAIERHSRLDPELLASLAAYGREALGESALDEWMLPVVAGCGFLYVGRAQGEVVGAAEIIACREAGELYLEGLYIRPGFQGRGYGSALLAGVTSWLRREGYRRLLATVAPENAAGRRLYERGGFAEAGFLGDHYGPGRDRLLLKLTLERRGKHP